jgi:hypothetical protein
MPRPGSAAHPWRVIFLASFTAPAGEPCGPRPVAVGRSAPSLLQPAHFNEVNTEYIEPGQQTLQGRAVGYLAAQHGLDRCDG